MSWIRALEKWRKDRDIVVSSGKYAEMIEEEIQEYKDAESIEEAVDAIGDIIVLSVNEMALKGYHIDMVMTEIVKEISSRQQCPEQANRDWKSKEKWKKDKNQDKDTLYKADFSNCRIEE